MNNINLAYAQPRLLSATVVAVDQSHYMKTETTRDNDKHRAYPKYAPKSTRTDINTILTRVQYSEFDDLLFSVYVELSTTDDAYWLFVRFRHLLPFR